MHAPARALPNPLARLSIVQAPLQRAQTCTMPICHVSMQGLAGDYYSTSAGQREKMLSSTQRLEKSSDHLHHGRQQLLQTEVWVFVCKRVCVHVCVHECGCVWVWVGVRVGM